MSFSIGKKLGKKISQASSAIIHFAERNNTSKYVGSIRQLIGVARNHLSSWDGTLTGLNKVCSQIDESIYFKDLPPRLQNEIAKHRADLRQFLIAEYLPETLLSTTDPEPPERHPLDSFDARTSLHQFNQTTLSSDTLEERMSIQAAMKLMEGAMRHYENNDPLRAFGIFSTLCKHHPKTDLFIKGYVDSGKAAINKLLSEGYKLIEEQNYQQAFNRFYAILEHIDTQNRAAFEGYKICFDHLKRTSRSKDTLLQT